MPEFSSAMIQGASRSESKVTDERFNYNVDVLENYILPEWEDKEYQKSLEDGAEDRFRRHRAIIRLLHRRNFFKRKDLLEEIEGTLPEELGSQTGSSKEEPLARTSSP